mmetsp:Transcript_47646/g.102014  ORF Transcript_47646/g.102014 Transcript_47646/m.102014 type:complete len:377 (-) Transcript_47646:412-1542(-)
MEPPRDPDAAEHNALKGTTSSTDQQESPLADSKKWWLGLTKVLEDWARDAQVKKAPEGAYIVAKELVQVAVQDLARMEGNPYAQDFCNLSQEKMFVLVRNAANVVAGRVEQRKTPYGTAAGNTFWNLTCPALQAQERKVGKMLNKGYALEKDPEKHRVVTKEEGSHFARYTTELLELNCGPVLLELKLFPNAKELTESFACFAAVRTHLGSVFKPTDPEVTVLVVGDGMTPRTAALFAFRTSWRCVSVDPLLKEREGPETSPWGESVERLTALRGMVEEMPILHSESVLIVMPHAHVGLEATLQRVRWRRHLGVLAMPCCNFYKDLGLPDAKPHIEKEDPGIVSPHRLLRLWNWSADVPEALPRAVAACLEPSGGE